MPRVAPLSFEQLGLDRGVVLYSAVAVPPEAGSAFRIGRLHDRAYFLIDGVYAGVLEGYHSGRRHQGGPGLPGLLRIRGRGHGRPADTYVALR